MPAYSDARYKAGDFPAAEASASSVLSLPMHPYLTSGQLKQVAAEIFKLVDKKNQASVPSIR
jgi:UDP-2-acetamido-2-deoxy-ribo-hexuluronate aminotransferase